MAKKRKRRYSPKAGRFVAQEVREFKAERRGRKVGSRRTQSREQAIAIGLARARRAGLKVPRKNVGFGSY